MHLKENLIKISDRLVQASELTVNVNCKAVTVYNTPVLAKVTAKR